MPAVVGGPGDGRSSRWQSHREERRRELIKSARRAVHVLGSDASMEDIAAAAGTSKSVFYRYFGDKAGLQQAVGEVVLSQMQRRIQEAAQSAVTPREGLLAMVTAYLQMASTSPNVYTFVTRHAAAEPDTSQDPAAGSAALGHFFCSRRRHDRHPHAFAFGGRQGGRHRLLAQSGNRAGTECR